jgi:hypothetical protein
MEATVDLNLRRKSFRELRNRTSAGGYRALTSEAGAVAPKKDAHGVAQCRHAIWIASAASISFPRVRTFDEGKRALTAISGARQARCFDQLHQTGSTTEQVPSAALRRPNQASFVPSGVHSDRAVPGLVWNLGPLALSIPQRQDRRGTCGGTLTSPANTWLTTQSYHNARLTSANANI